jgi:hypothetical protein
MAKRPEKPTAGEPGESKTDESTDITGELMLRAIIHMVPIFFGRVELTEERPRRRR